MKAMVYHKYGPPDVLELQETDKPVVDDDSVVVRVCAASVNAGDWRLIRGRPYLVRLFTGLLKPKGGAPGNDLAGHVEAVGRKVTEFKPGDEVIGNRTGALAEYVSGKECNFVLKPARITFEQAAAVPVAALTALQGLRDAGQIRPGQKVLINGAAGGVGTFAVQIAKSFGAHVTGVCSTRNVDMARSIGADDVIDYIKDDFTRSGQRYDLILDIAGNRPLSHCRRVLSRNGVLVLVGGPNGRWLGPVTRWLQGRVMSWFVSQTLVPFLSKSSKEDLVVLKELIAAGKVTPVIDRTYPLSQTAEAIRYLEGGHARGKVVITMGQDDK
ncbi:MAG: NAD(P)-dependent alcohol dehydrogenase [Chloroflexota bacterium]|nr:NAD(P)-dependent alcohol dehydrogenase [Chloroflexota bacterium]MDQ5865776.1 NAD(P)-dependent alcohol dehydrogenase [Chloroflexota bacterium]